MELGPQLELSVLDGQAGLAAIADHSVSCQAEPRQSGPVTLWTVNLADHAGRTRWLELVLTGTPGLPVPAHYFNGTTRMELSAEPYETPGYRQALPLAALWNARGGLALGLEPHEVVSYVRHTAGAAGGKAQMSLHVRLVLEPGGRRSLSFLSLPLSGKWGFSEALGAYYDLAPDLYEPDPAVDPRLRSPSAMYAAWGSGPAGNELCRRNGAGWDWCYAPFKRTGDIAGRPEFWDYTPARPFAKGVPFDSLEGYHAWRKQRFSNGEASGVAMLFYVPAMVWCEERLAKGKYADALGTDPDTKNYFNTPWVTGHDNELRVFPWGTSYGEQGKRDLAAVARELDLSGFAFDTCEGTSRYFGPAVKRFPERAWDPKLGEYVREAVATMELRRYAHSLTNSRGHHLGVIGNTDLPYYLIARSIDGGLREAAPWNPERGTGDTQRYMLGRKPMVWWDGYDFPELVQYERMTPEQMADAYASLSDFVMLECFRVAYYPTVDFTRGVATAVAALPVLKDCLDAGWQPVPAATAPGTGFVTRYGKGLSTRLAIGNETLAELRPTVTVESTWLRTPALLSVRATTPEVLNPVPGDGAFIFASVDGRPTRNLLQGKTTRVEGLSLAPRKVAVLRAVACLNPAPSGLAVTATLQRSGLAMTVALSLEKPVAAKTWLGLPGLPEASAGVTLDGKVLPSALPLGATKIALQLQPGKGRSVVLGLGSLRYRLSETDLLGFPFVSADGKQTATIVLRPTATEAERQAAARLVEYFRYYYAKAPDTPLEVNLPLAQDAPGETRPQVVLDGSGEGLQQPVVAAAQVSRQGQRLTIRTAKPEQLLPAVLDLLRELDRKYAYPGDLPWRYHTNALGLVGKYIGLDGKVHGPVVAK